MGGPKTPCLSMLALDRLVDGALPPASATKARVHLQSCPRCSGRLEAMKVDHHLGVLWRWLRKP